MSEAAVAARLTEALAQAAAHAAGGPAPLLSVSIEIISPGDAAKVETRVERKTRTLAFMSAEAFTADAKRIASATSVHTIASA